VPEPRLPLPEPERPRPVPRKYHDLVGKHEAHPGTGQGYAANRRRDDLLSEDEAPPRAALSFRNPA
jgi:hypothetical protein